MLLALNVSAVTCASSVLARNEPTKATAVQCLLLLSPTHSVTTVTLNLRRSAHNVGWYIYLVHRQAHRQIVVYTVALY
jgi:hypothetical protein